MSDERYGTGSRRETSDAVTGKTAGRNNRRYTYRAVCGLILTMAFTGVFFYVWMTFVVKHNQTGHLLGMGNLLMSTLIYAGLCVFLFRWMKGYKIGVYRKSNTLASQIAALFMLDFLEIFISMAITGEFRFFRAFFLRYFLVFLVDAVLDVVLVIPMVNLYRRLFPPLRVLEIYGEYTRDDEQKDPLFEKMNGTIEKYRVEKRISCSEDRDFIEAEILRYDAVLLNDLPNQMEKELLKYCFLKNKRVYYTPKLADILVKSSDDLNIFDTPLYFRRNNGMSMWQRFWKRFFDVLLSFIALVILSPLFLIVSILIKAEDGGPVFFRQDRVTRNGRVFEIIKFRSMRVDAEKDGLSHPAENDDDRITKVGRVIRATRIDELPQIINILRGDMSIVGPRPERVEHVQMYSENIPEFPLREKVKGGLTGYAQVYGKYNTSALDKLKMDLIYINNYSLVLDLQILFETLRVIFSKESTEGFTADQEKEIKEYEGKN